MDIGKVMATTTECVVEFGGERCIVRYFPHKFTPRLQADLRKAQDNGGDPVATLAPFIIAMVGTWDLTNGGKKVPITEEALSDLPATFLDRVIKAIAEDMSPNREAANGSVAGSFTAAE